jgi:hypothetical protein
MSGSAICRAYPVLCEKGCCFRHLSCCAEGCEQETVRLNSKMASHLGVTEEEKDEKRMAEIFVSALSASGRRRQEDNRIEGTH